MGDLTVVRRRQIVPAYWSNQPEAEWREGSVRYLGYSWGWVWTDGRKVTTLEVRHLEQVVFGRRYYLGEGVTLWGHPDGLIQIGNNVWIGPGAFLEGRGWVYIGDNVAIAPYAKLLTSQHTLEPADRPVFQTDLVVETTVIEDGAEVGTGAIIMPGVTVGTNALVGAGAVVTRDVRAGTIVVGNPARLLRERR